MLGEVQRGDQPIRPSPGQRIAVRQQQNIRALNVYTDGDDVVRRLPLIVLSRWQRRCPRWPSSSPLARSMPTPEFSARTAALAGYRIPAAVANTMTLNFEGGADDIPTYSLADLRACAERRQGFFRREFDGKVVLFGTVLDVEDRKLTSKRFATGKEGAQAPRCARRQQAGQHIVSTAARYRRRLYARHRRQQSDRANAVTEFGQLPIFADRGRLRGTRGRGGPAAQPIGRCRLLPGYRRIDGSVRPSLFTSARAAAGRALLAGLAALAAMIGYRFVAADKDRLLRRELCALSRARGHRPDDGVEQAAGARRRDAQHHGVLFRPRRLL